MMRTRGFMPAITTILCPVDRSPISARALAYATSLARAHGARIHVLEVIEHAVPSVPVPPADFVVPDALRRVTLQELKQFSTVASKAGVIADIRLREGSVAREILADARDSAVDLIVIGTHGRSGFERLALGSVTEKVLHTASCPVLAVPPGDEHPADRPFRTVLCPTDFSEAGDAAVDYARFLSRIGGTATLVLVNVIEWPFGHTQGDDAVSRLRRSLEEDARQQLQRLSRAEGSDLEVQTLVLTGNPGRQIVEAARSRLADLIVMGVTGRGALDLALLGSTTHRVVRHAPCPVLTVRTP
jgi:nucleotide-binding universal stress UspA family protein